MRLKSVLSTLGIACALVVGLDYVSFAATGNSVILGHSNSANAATTFTRTTAGTAVSFKSKTGYPSIAVNQPTKISHLNADLLDGKDSTAFAPLNKTRIYKYTAASAATSHQFDIPVPAAGQYLLTYSVPTTLAGTTTTNETLFCEIGQSTGIFGTFQASGWTSTASVPTAGPAAGPTLGVSATAVINPSAFGSLYVYCSGSSAWTTPPQVSFLGTSLAQPAVVTLTKLSSPSTSSISASKVSAKQQAAMRARAGQ